MNAPSRTPFYSAERDQRPVRAVDAKEQRRRVFAMLMQIDCWRLRLRDRAGDGQELIEELELCGDALERIADDARKLAADLDEALISEESRAAAE